MEISPSWEEALAFPIGKRVGEVKVDEEDIEDVERRGDTAIRPERGVGGRIDHPIAARRSTIAVEKKPVEKMSSKKKPKAEKKSAEKKPATKKKLVEKKPAAEKKPVEKKSIEMKPATENQWRREKEQVIGDGSGRIENNVAL
ncbi:hypothetical protein BHM03_00028429 [Ensete ventricosum]|nr:hypothetical protein BHM03_00028429 [Ensete ventricosum]